MPSVPSYGEVLGPFDERLAADLVAYQTGLDKVIAYRYGSSAALGWTLPVFLATVADKARYQIRKNAGRITETLAGARDAIVDTLPDPFREDYEAAEKQVTVLGPETEDISSRLDDAFDLVLGTPFEMPMIRALHFPLLAVARECIVDISKHPTGSGLDNAQAILDRNRHPLGNEAFMAVMDGVILPVATSAANRTDISPADSLALATRVTEALGLVRAPVTPGKSCRGLASSAVVAALDNSILRGALRMRDEGRSSEDIESFARKYSSGRQMAEAITRYATGPEAFGGLN